MSPEQKAEIDAAMERLRPLLKPGVVITHTRCLGIVEEHVFCRIDRDRWICGHPTRDTMLIRKTTSFADDISPRSVTHINREPVELWNDPDLGKVPEAVAYQPSPEQAKASLTLGIIERNRIGDRDAIHLIRELFDEAGPDLAVAQWDRQDRHRLLDEIPFEEMPF